MNPCKFQNYLTAYVLGDMDQKRLDAMDVHLKSCSNCQKQAAELRSTISLLKEAFPTEKEVAGNGPVLNLERRQQLLMIKPVPKQSVFMHFIVKAARPLRMIAATLLCVVGILAILSARLFSTASKSARSGDVFYRKTLDSAIDGKEAGRAMSQLEAKPEGLVFSDAEVNSLVATSVGGRLDGTSEKKNNSGDQLLHEKGAFEYSRSLKKEEDAKKSETAAWYAAGQDARTETRSKRERFDEGLEVPPPSSSPATEPLVPQPLEMKAIRSPVILKGIKDSVDSPFGGRTSEDQAAFRRRMPAPKVAEPEAPAEITVQPAPPATPAPDIQYSERESRITAPSKPTAAVRLGAKSGKLGKGGAIVTEAGENNLRQMEELVIDAPKPTFAGTPKDIRSDNLEAPGSRNNQPASYPVVTYGSKQKGAAKKGLEATPKKPEANLTGADSYKYDVRNRDTTDKAVSERFETTINGVSSIQEQSVISAGTLAPGKAVMFTVPDAPRDQISVVDENSDGTMVDDFKKNVPAQEITKRLDDVSVVRLVEQEKARLVAKEQSQAQQEEKKRMAEVAADGWKTPPKPREPLPFNSFVLAAAEPFSTFAMDVDTASYTLTRQALRSGKLPEPERVRLEEIVNAFDYDDTAPDRATFRVYQDGAQSPFGAGYNLLRISVKGKRLGREEQRPAMLTFVIDVSGSMSQPDRIGFARQALASLLDQVSPKDRIQMIAYSDQARFVLPPSPATEKARIMAAFDQLQCNGSTNLEEGLRRAYEQAAQAFIPGAENRVILISDGVANLGADSAQEILDKVAANRKQGITCSVFGVGAGTYNDQMLEELANKGDGVYRFLDSLEAVKTAFVDDLAATLNTIAKDAKIQVEWNPKAVRRYRQMGYENRKLTKEQFRDDTVDAGEVGSGQSVTALYELELMPEVTQESNLGTVRIRYQRTDNGKVEEIEATLVASTVLRPAHKASVPFRVAASAAEFAELLRGSPNAQDGRFDAVADYLRPAALERTLDTRIKELLELVTTANALSK